MAHQTARLPDENDLTPAEKDPSRTPVPGQSPPHAGRTGGAGARAERPSEGSARKTAAGSTPGRGAKSPSAATDARAPDAGKVNGNKDEAKKRGNGLPQPVRDSGG